MLQSSMATALAMTQVATTLIKNQDWECFGGPRLDIRRPLLMWLLSETDARSRGRVSISWRSRSKPLDQDYIRPLSASHPNFVAVPLEALWLQ
jgi:hypothetical protein